MKTRPVGAELLLADGWTDRQTDMTKLLVDFCNFAKCLKITSKVVETYETFALHSGTETPHPPKKKNWRKNSCIPLPVTQTVVWCHQLNCSRKTQRPNCTLVKKKSNYFFK
jgi:hypothetical protein